MIDTAASGSAGLARAVAGIPYRTGSAVPAASLAWAILVTLLVLGGVIGGLLLARRRGWLRPWIGQSRSARPSSSPWRVTARMRLSATARAYVLESEHVGYLVIESSQHVVVQPQSVSTGVDHASEE